MRTQISLLVFLCLCGMLFGQDISLFQQFNGRYDYTAIGNTMNPFENNLDAGFCDVPDQSAASLLLQPQQNLIRAYLYWAGSGPADASVQLNGITVESEFIYEVPFDSSSGQLIYFSCVADVSEIVSENGNGEYLLSDLDISAALAEQPGYCNTRTNFAGWSLYIIYEDDSLPLNQISLFQGLEIINTNVTEKTILLDNINVLDNQGAKIGFLAWEGDDSLNYGESLSINDNILSNPPLNLSDNAFNGTNTFTNSSDFYNADLDVYNIQNNISIGDTAATIRITTGDFDENGVFRADLIILNNVITVLNSQLPDATVEIDEIITFCNSNSIEVLYTVFNTNSTDPLPADTPLAFYADGQLVGQSHTAGEIAIGGSESATITLVIPADIGLDFDLQINVDDDGNGQGIIDETDESNNTALITLNLPVSEPDISLPALLSCDTGFNQAEFNLTTQLELINGFDTSTASYYSSREDAVEQLNEILIPENYINGMAPQLIFLRVENSPCYQIFSFELNVENCPPTIPQGFSPNGDGFNDWFNIQGLYDIFDRHELLIYNRYGTLIFKGNNSLKWDGRSNQGPNGRGKLLPVGTYFYVLHLNDPEYESLAGWVYLNY